MAYGKTIYAILKAKPQQQTQMLNKEVVSTLIIALEDYLDFQTDDAELARIAAVPPARVQWALNILRLYSQFMN